MNPCGISRIEISGLVKRGVSPRGENIEDVGKPGRGPHQTPDLLYLDRGWSQPKCCEGNWLLLKLPRL